MVMSCVSPVTQSTGCAPGSGLILRSMEQAFPLGSAHVTIPNDHSHPQGSLSGLTTHVRAKVSSLHWHKLPFPRAHHQFRFESWLSLLEEHLERAAGLGTLAQNLCPSLN